MIGSVGQWRTIHHGGRPYLAHCTLGTDGLFVAVVYRDPNVGAHYVRGESDVSLDDAIALAFSLIDGLPVAPPEPEPVLTRLALPDGATVMVAFDEMAGEETLPEMDAAVE